MLQSGGKATEGSFAAKRASKPRRGKQPKSEYSESHHLAGKPQEAIELYRAVDRFCLSLKPGEVEKHFLAKYVSYTSSSQNFCSLHILQGGLRLWVKLKYKDLDDPPSFVRDVSKVGHWGLGDVEIGVSNQSHLELATKMINLSFQSQVG